MKAIITLTVLFLTLAILTSCNKDEITCSNGEIFCYYVNKEEFNKTGPTIDNFLKDLKKKLSDEEKLERLVDWLKCKSCVSNAEILCVSCIKTNPPQSEIKVWFIINGQIKTQILDIIMDDPLRFRTFHD